MNLEILHLFIQAFGLGAQIGQHISTFEALNGHLGVSQRVGDAIKLKRNKFDGKSGRWFFFSRSYCWYCLITPLRKSISFWGIGPFVNRLITPAPSSAQVALSLPTYCPVRMDGCEYEKT
ncbi:MAG: hypothetical protein WDO14_14265 [Bacteroidota bacterium]